MNACMHGKYHVYMPFLIKQNITCFSLTMLLFGPTLKILPSKISSEQNYFMLAGLTKKDT